MLLARLAVPVALLVTASSVAAAPPLQAVTLAGRVTVRLKASPEKETPVAGGVVYLGATDAVGKAAPGTTVTAKVTGGKLVPDYFAVAAGGRVVVEVEDKEPYNILFFARDDFGRTVPPDPTRVERVFAEPEPCVSVKCSIHPTLKGNVTVVPNPVHTRTAADGSFALAFAVPPGGYVVHAYHPDHGGVKRPFAVTAGEKPGPVDLALPAGK